MAGDSFSVHVEGLDDFIRTIDKLAEGVKPSVAEPIFQKGAQVIAKEAKASAPVRKQEQHNRGGTGSRKAPGVLKRAIKVKMLRGWTGAARPYIAAIDRKPAAHAWLVIHGTKGKRTVSPPRWVVINGRPAVISHTGVMPRNPFWGDSIRSKQDEVLKMVADELGKSLEEAMR